MSAVVGVLANNHSKQDSKQKLAAGSVVGEDANNGKREIGEGVLIKGGVACSDFPSFKNLESLCPRKTPIR